MPDLGLPQAVTLFLGMKFLGVEKPAHPPETYVADFDDPVPFQGNIKIIAQAAAAGAYDGFAPDFHSFAPKLIFTYSSYH
jgi:hypothetical protein